MAAQIEPPEVVQGKQEVRGLIAQAVSTLRGLLTDDSATVRLGAVQEVFDRGGIPKKSEVFHDVDTTGLDAQIETMMEKVLKVRSTSGLSLVEDAEVVEDEEPEPDPTPVLEVHSTPEPVPPDPEPEEYSWQAKPRAPQ